MVIPLYNSPSQRSGSGRRGLCSFWTLCNQSSEWISPGPFRTHLPWRCCTAGSRQSGQQRRSPEHGLDQPAQTETLVSLTQLNNWGNEGAVTIIVGSLAVTFLSSWKALMYNKLNLYIEDSDVFLIDKASQQSPLWKLGQTEWSNILA